MAESAKEKEWSMLIFTTQHRELWIYSRLDIFNAQMYSSSSVFPSAVLYFCYKTLVIFSLDIFNHWIYSNPLFKAEYIQCSDVFKLFCIPIRSCSMFLLQNFGYIHFGYIQSLDIFKPIFWPQWALTCFFFFLYIQIFAYFQVMSLSPLNTHCLYRYIEREIFLKTCCQNAKLNTAILYKER